MNMIWLNSLQNDEYRILSKLYEGLGQGMKGTDSKRTTESIQSFTIYFTQLHQQLSLTPLSDFLEDLCIYAIVHNQSMYTLYERDIRRQKYQI